MNEVIAALMEYSRRKGFNSVAEVNGAHNADLLTHDVMEAAQ